jgi:fucose permease
MLLTAATELGTNQRIESLLGQSAGVSALLVLAFINGLMAVGRLFGGDVAHRLSIPGMLLFSAIFSCLGLYLLTLTTGWLTFGAAAVFAIGITYFWPTMISFVAEYIPESGALGLSVMGGLGMLSAGLFLPIIGSWLEGASGVEALRSMAVLPAILIVLFGGLFFYMRGRETSSSAAALRDSDVMETPTSTR